MAWPTGQLALSERYRSLSPHDFAGLGNHSLRDFAERPTGPKYLTAICHATNPYGRPCPSVRSPTRAVVSTANSTQELRWFFPQRYCLCIPASNIHPDFNLFGSAGSAGKRSHVGCWCLTQSWFVWFGWFGWFVWLRLLGERFPR